MKADTLNALRSEEGCRSERFPPGTVDEGLWLGISARLVFLQDQPAGPLTGARRECAPVSRLSLFAICSGRIARQRGLTVRPSGGEYCLEGFEIETAVSVPQEAKQAHMEVHGRTSARALQCLAFDRVGRFPSRSSSELPTGSTSVPLYLDGAATSRGWTEPAWLWRKVFPQAYQDRCVL